MLKKWNNPLTDRNISHVKKRLVSELDNYPRITYIHTQRTFLISTNTNAYKLFSHDLVQGEFFPPSRYHDPQIKLNPTIGRKYIIKCPAHRSGYGTKVKWGTVSESTNLPSFFATARPHKRGFPMSGNQFAFSYITRDDLIFSKNVGGMRCILVNFGFIVASAQMVLWQAYNSM